MQTPVFGSLRVLVAATCLASGACSLNVHDNTVNIKDPKVTFNTDVDVNNVKPGQDVPITINAQNVYLVDPKDTPPPEHTADAGHFQIYFDDVNTQPILITAQTKVSVTVPAMTRAGGHKFICRVHKHDGTPTSATFEVNITVVATVTTMGSALPPTSNEEAQPQEALPQEALPQEALSEEIQHE